MQSKNDEEYEKEFHIDAPDLYEQAENMLRAMRSAHCLQQVDFEDCLQASLMVFTRNVRLYKDTLEEIKNQRAYFCGIAKKNVLSAKRVYAKEKKRIVVNTEFMNEQADRLEINIHRELLEEAISRMDDDKDKLYAHFYYLDQLSNSEISSITKIRLSELTEISHRVVIKLRMNIRHIEDQQLPKVAV